MKSDSVFERSEKKYLISVEAARSAAAVLSGRMDEDSFGAHTVFSLYFDTPDNRLIARSLEKPVYREKLRLRCYGVPKPGDRAYAELKKKFKGVTYKRRVAMEFCEAMRFLCGGETGRKNGQIEREIRYLMERNPGIGPSMLISYDRRAYYGRGGEGDLRVTFDRNILWRDEALDPSLGVRGERVIGEDRCLMEIKAAGAVPLWLTHLLDEMGIYPVSFSKYAAAYKQSARRTVEDREYGRIA